MACHSQVTLPIVELIPNGYAVPVCAWTGRDFV